MCCLVTAWFLPLCFTVFHFDREYGSGSSVRASQPFPLMGASTGCLSLSKKKSLILSAECWVSSCPILPSYSAPFRPSLLGIVPKMNLLLPSLVRPFMKKLTVLIPLRQRSLPPLWMFYGTGPSNTMDWCGLLTWQRSMSSVWFSSLPGRKMLVLGRLLGLVQWVTLSRRWSKSSMSGGTWNLKSTIRPGCYLPWTVPARGPRPMIFLPLPMCWPAKEILSISYVHMFWKWYGDTDSGQPPLPSLSGSTITIVLVYLPRCAGPSLPRPVLFGVIILDSARSLLSVTLGLSFKYTSRLFVATWLGLTFKRLCSGPFIPCTSQWTLPMTTWSKWRYSSRKESHASLVQPLIAPLLSRTGRRRWWKKAAGSILAKTQTPWSFIEFTSQLRRCARFLNLPSSISFLLTPKNRNTREQLSLLSSQQGLSSLAQVIGPLLPRCGIYWTCVEAWEGGLFITRISGSNIRKSWFTRGISLPVMSDVTATPCYWRIARVLMLPRGGWLMPLCLYLVKRQDPPP